MSEVAEHRAVDVRGEPYVPVGEFDFVTHDRWVSAGFCPVVSRTKAWCNRLAGHPESTHGSPFKPVEERGPYWLEWTE